MGTEPLEIWWGGGGKYWIERENIDHIQSRHIFLELHFTIFRNKNVDRPTVFFFFYRSGHEGTVYYMLEKANKIPPNRKTKLVRTRSGNECTVCLQESLNNTLN